MSEIVKQAQIPVGIFAALQAGSVAFISSYFEFIKVKYNMRDEIFDTVEFTQNASILFGIIPGFILLLLKPKKSTILGTIMVIASLVLTLELINGERQHITENAQSTLFAVSVLSGQGACLVLLAVIQALLNMQTVLATSIVCPVIFGYFWGAESLTQMIMHSLLDESSFESMLTYLIVSGVLVIILAAVVISDEEDGEGGSGFSLSALQDKAKTLASGILYSHSGVLYIIMLTIYTVVLMICFFSENLISEAGTSSLLILAVLNLIVPVCTFNLLSQETIEGWVENINDFEKDLLDKGVDLSFGEAASGLSYWYLVISTIVIVGSTYMMKENARPFALQDADRAIALERGFLVFLVAGALSCFLMQIAQQQAQMGLAVRAFLHVIFMSLMIYPDMVPHSLEIATYGSAFTGAGWIVCCCIFVHREYGTETFGPIFGSFLTAGAAGFFAFNEVLFAQVFEGYAPTNSFTHIKEFTSYGDWNEALFGITTAAALISFMLTVVCYCSLRQDSSGSKTDFVF